MATTIREAFQIFKTRLEISSLQQSTVSTRHQNVREAINKERNVQDSFLTGSYSRHTMISPLKEADIDIFVVLDNDYFYHYNGKNGGQAGLLDLIKYTLKKTYPRSPDISRNGQAVTIQFSDFLVDVVPSFNREGGGFIIPNSVKQTWISTDPKKHVEIFSYSNQVHKNDLIPLIKMIKRWNKTINHFFTSFHLEVLALQILENVSITDYPSGMRFFFNKARSVIKNKNLDPSGYGGDVGHYLNTNEKINNAVSRFETAYNRALKANDFYSRQYYYEAFDMWKKIFGDYFPSYS
jgi:SMODS domain-containing protein